MYAENIPGDLYTKELSGDTLYIRLPDEYQGEEDPPYLSIQGSYLFQVNCVLEDLDSYMEGVQHYSHPEHYIPVGSGKLGNYVMIYTDGYEPEHREEGYDWELYDAMHADRDYIIEHTYVTPLEEDPF